MKRWITTLAATIAALAATAGTALAADPVQSATQSSSTGQAALAASSATQVAPSNQNISVRVLSPGSDGAVSQSNTADSSANATNAASTTQSATQTQAGCGCVPRISSGQIDDVLAGAMQAAGANAAPAAAPSGQANDAASAGAASNAAPTTQTSSQSAPTGGGGVQSSTQDASTTQVAGATSSAEQIHPSNSNISVRVLSPGNDGSVDQSNTADSHASADNTATTTQAGTQAGGGGGVQSSTQGADTHQGSAAISSAKQVHPENKNLSVRVLSPGNGGDVTQSNDATSHANADNTATTTQTATQTGSGSSCGCHGSGSSVQSSDQSSDTKQVGLAASSAEQIKPSNDNASVRVGSWGNDGSVDQSNTADSHATADNTASTTQTGAQTGGGVQSSTQDADTHQGAAALSSAKQIHPENSNLSVRVGSPGNGGDVTQSNDAASHATTDNTATTTQSATQAGGDSCGCIAKDGYGKDGYGKDGHGGGSSVQSSDQSSRTKQAGLAASSAEQIAPSNENGPIRIGSWGNDGSVYQSNDADSHATASNSAPVTQTATQTGSGSPCGCYGGGTSVQAAGQSSKVGQAAFAASHADQIHPSNDNSPVRIWSPGNDGYVDQSNDVSSRANADNRAPVTQSATQSQSGGCGCSGVGVQALGQESHVGQLAVGLSHAAQIGASNDNAPVRIGSWGGGGSVDQSNDASSHADATNTATPTQTGTQTQSGSGIQALGQSSKVGQAALAASSALQLPGRSECGCGGSSGNTSAPVRIWSPGYDGSVSQSNTADSRANAGNTATPTQRGTQTQSGGCACSGIGVQALGQYATVDQLAAALSHATQIGASNDNRPVRIKSWGGGGYVDQSNDARSRASAPNVSRLLQAGTQVMV